MQKRLTYSALKPLTRRLIAKAKTRKLYSPLQRKQASHGIRLNRQAWGRSVSLM